MATIGCVLCAEYRALENLGLSSNFLSLFVSPSINLYLLVFPLSYLFLYLSIWASLRSYTLQICFSTCLHLDDCEMCTICESILKLFANISRSSSSRWSSDDDWQHLKSMHSFMYIYILHIYKNANVPNLTKCFTNFFNVRNIKYVIFVL